MASIGWALLVLSLLVQLHPLAAYGVHPDGNLTHHSTPSHCRPDQANTLLKLKQSFDLLDSITTLSSWQASTDCCLWEGVGCSNSSLLGHAVVTALDLSGFGLNSNGMDPVLFNLTSLRLLDLSMNDFRGYDISSLGFERLSLLSHLNLSCSGISGQVPLGISKLTNLVSLDLSGRFFFIGDSDSIVDTPYSHLSLPYFDTLVANLSNLRELYLDVAVNISSSAEDCFRALAKSVPHLRVLSLGLCSLQGHIDSSLSRLKSLAVINLSDNDITPGPFPEFLMNFPNLRVLQLSGINLQGWFPRGMFLSENLRVLDLSWNPNLSENLSSLKFLIIESCGNLFGKLPSAIGNMSNLERLDISYCQFSGSIPHEVGALKKLKSLALPYNGLSGRIPSAIANLTQLTELALDRNYLSGEIPTFLFTLPALQYLDLSENQLCGPIHEFNGISSHLQIVWLQSNELTGQIPWSLFALPNLSELYISYNNFMGLVDLDLLWMLENLTSLYISHNKLIVMEREGANSSSVYPSQLRHLGLASCGITKIPNLLMRLNHVEYLDLSSNKISGDIPKWIWEIWSNEVIGGLNISHNMITGMELNSSVIPFSKTLDILDLISNRLQGQVPMPESSAEFLDYSNNTFSSLLQNLTLYLRHTNYLRLSNNNISGHLPHSICDSPMEILDLSYNNFTGPVPSCLMENGVLRVINLRENQFKGMLPSNISSACSFQTIDLHGNKIEGQLPRALNNCIDLEVLDLGRNKIVDTFPSWLGGLLNLRVLVLRSNQFHGSIGYLEDEESGHQFASLQIIDLASNNFSGNLHPDWFENLKSMKKYNNTGQIISHPNASGFYQDSVTISYKGLMVTFERILSALTAIDISANALEGSIPALIGNLCSLHILNLSHNAFSEEIPPQLGSITALESLDLSSNMLSGEIPQELTDLTFLSILNVSNNQLVGRIPQSHQFTTFQNSSFDGNVGLCGPPLSKPCGTPTNTQSEEHPKKSFDIVLFLFVGVGFGVGFAIAILMKQDWMWRWLHIIRIL